MGFLLHRIAFLALQFHGALCTNITKVICKSPSSSTTAVHFGTAKNGENETRNYGKAFTPSFSIDAYRKGSKWTELCFHLNASAGPNPHNHKKGRHLFLLTWKLKSVCELEVAKEKIYIWPALIVQTLPISGRKWGDKSKLCVEESKNRRR